MARTKSQRSKAGSGRARTPRRLPPATRTRPRAARGDTSTGMLAGAGSAMGKVLQKSSEVVKEAGTGLLNTARQEWNTFNRAVTDWERRRNFEQI